MVAHTRHLLTRHRNEFNAQAYLTHSYVYVVCPSLSHSTNVSYVGCSGLLLSHYCLTATIGTILSKFRFKKKEGIKKKFLMTAASMSR